MSAIIQKYPVEHPGTWDPPQVQPALQTIVAPVRTMLLLLLAIVVLLLVIACANVTNLTLARATARRSEFTIRGALGASRGRLATQLCWEMSLLSAVGGIVGVALGWVALQAFSGAASRIMPRWENVSVDFVVVGYVIAVLVLTTIATGVLPALASRRDLVSGLNAAGRSGAGDAGATKVLRSSLVIAEIALALAVVLSAGLVVRSFVALMQVPVGFNSENLYIADVPGLPRSRYRDHTSALLAVQQLASQLRSIPGVTSVAIAASPPFLGEITTFTTIPGTPSALPVDVNVVSPGYFATMGIPLLRGRDFDDRDRFKSQQVAIVSATFARRFFGTLDVLGKTYDPEIGWADREVRTIVGVASDTRNSLHTPSAPLQYLVTAQVPGFFGEFAIRTSGADPQLTQVISAAYAKVDPQFPAPNVRSYQQIFLKDSGNAQAAAMLFGVLALLALLLALAGTYALSAYGVEQQTRELGIRKALGASDVAILTNILLGALRVSSLGIAIGLVVAALCARLLTPVLFETSPFDPVTFVGVVILVTVCSVFAALVPAIRATRIQPAVALRYE
jgi:putative ABC transport system permease protein